LFRNGLVLLKPSSTQIQPLSIRSAGLESTTFEDNPSDAYSSQRITKDRDLAFGAISWAIMGPLCTVAYHAISPLLLPTGSALAVTDFLRLWSAAASGF
jgi:hypothetical protein